MHVKIEKKKKKKKIRKEKRQPLCVTRVMFENLTELFILLTSSKRRTSSIKGLANEGHTKANHITRILLRKRLSFDANQMKLAAD